MAESRSTIVAETEALQWEADRLCSEHRAGTSEVQQQTGGNQPLFFRIGQKKSHSMPIFRYTICCRLVPEHKKPSPFPFYEDRHPDSKYLPAQ